MVNPKQSSEELVAALASKDGAERIKAREALIQIGPSAVTELLRALGAPQQHVRWEAAKILTAIADPSAAEKLVGTLGDEDPDVRWVAGEALIALRHAGLRPLLVGLTKSQDSEGLYEAAHHVLHDLANNIELAPIAKPVLDALGESEPELAVPIAAERALESMAD
jgi:HEAT repeat protein